jgi:hypothetical protein
LDKWSRERFRREHYFLIILIMDIKSVVSEREDLLFHEQGFLGGDAEGGVDADGFGEGLEAD